MSEPGGVFGIDPQAFMAPADEVPPESDPRPQAAGPASATAAEGIASLGRIEQELADVEDALTRLDDGRYGLCDVCAAPVGDDWLVDHPAERLCPGHRSTAGESSGGAGEPRGAP